MVGVGSNGVDDANQTSVYHLYNQYKRDEEKTREQIVPPSLLASVY